MIIIYNQRIYTVLLLKNLSRRTVPKFGTHVRIDTLALKKILTHPNPGGFRGLNCLARLALARERTPSDQINESESESLDIAYILASVLIFSIFFIRTIHLNILISIFLVGLSIVQPFTLPKSTGRHARMREVSGPNGIGFLIYSQQTRERL